MSVGAVRARVRITPRAAVLGVVIVALATALAVPLRQYFAQRAEMAALEERVEALTEQRIALRERIEQLRDPEYLERLARRCLGMVRPGEVSFVTVPEHGRGRPSRC